ncbi:MAG: ice-binding family protein, partial [Candidatus Uhrbacteria bacterium]|nr:ice-binding family protein [Candidatus Uhrbacteria bacterium]
MKKFNTCSMVAGSVIALALGLTWQVALAAGPATVNLGASGNFVILAKTGVSTTGATSVVGDIGVSPAQATYITGFALTLPAASAFSTSALVTGKVYAPGYSDPAPAQLTTAVLDMQTAYTDAAGRAPTVTELGAGNIGGMTLVPGTYKWSTSVTIPTNVTLSGGANDVWIFQIAQNLDISSATHVVLAGGAQAGNIFWQVAGQTTIGTTAVFNGNILDQTTIVLNTGATLNGRALAQAAVTLDASTVTVPVLVTAATAVVAAVPATPAVSATPSSGTGTTATPASPAVSATPAVPATPASGNSMSNADRAALIAQIMEQINVLRAKINAQSVATPSANAVTNANMSASFKRNLAAGSSGEDVRTLQVFLNTHGYAVVSSGPGSSGNETMNFGALTRAALAKFQASVGITPALGNFGAITRA